LESLLIDWNLLANLSVYRFVSIGRAAVIVQQVIGSSQKNQGSFF
jgi:hypothetical protein